MFLECAVTPGASQHDRPSNSGRCRVRGIYNSALSTCHNVWLSERSRGLAVEVRSRYEAVSAAGFGE